MAKTVVKYNGVELHNVHTLGWDQELVFDASGTDLLYSKFSLRFSGIVHAQNVGTATLDAPAWIALEGGNAPGNAAETFAAVRSRLSQPRGHLKVYFGDDLVVDCASPTGDTAMLPSQDAGAHTGADLDNGPKPRKVSLTNIAGDQVFRLEFSIDCAVVECPNVSPGKEPSLRSVINNRWSVNESIDGNFFTTRTIRGRLRLGVAVKNSHAFKSVVVPGLEAGFRRDKIDFTVAENGLDCEYSVVDKQVHQAAPWPATRMRLEYTELSNDGVNGYGEVSVQLDGSPEADSRLMFAQAITIVDDKLDLKIGQQNDEDEGMNVGYIVENCSIMERTGEENSVAVQMRIRHVLPKDADKVQHLANIYTEKFGRKIKPLPIGPDSGNYSVTGSREPALWGYEPWNANAPRAPASILFALSCYLQSPCDSRHAIYGGELSTEEPEETTEEPEYVPDVTSSTADLPPYEKDRYSEETKESLYTYVRMDSRYMTVKCRTQMPVAGQSTDSAESDSSAGSPDPSTSSPDDYETPSDPVPSNVHTCVFELARPQGRREIRVDFERAGKWPEIPEPMDEYTDGDLKGTLLRYWDRALPPTLAADKVQRLYRIEAYYLYALNRPPKKDEATRIGVLPQTNLTQEDNAFTREDSYTDRMKPGEEPK